MDAKNKPAPIGPTETIVTYTLGVCVVAVIVWAIAANMRVEKVWPF
jgi:hypothetical protein